MLVGTICAITLLGALNCFLYGNTCELPMLREFASELVAALIGIYAGSRSGRS